MSFSKYFALFLSLILVSFGCSRSNNTGFATGDDDDTVVGDDDDFGDDDDSYGDDDDTDTGDDDDAPPANWETPVPQYEPEFYYSTGFGGRCNGAPSTCGYEYRQLYESLLGPVTEQDRAAQAQAAFEADPTQVAALTTANLDGLAQAVYDGLNLQEIESTDDTSPLELRLAHQGDYSWQAGDGSTHHYGEYDFTILHPLYGELTGVLLQQEEIPRGVIVYSPGHAERASSMIGSYGGRRAAQRGYTVVAPDVRANDGSGVETEAVLGFGIDTPVSLLTVRVGEIRLVAAAARWLEPDAPLVLAGHSGSSVAIRAAVLVTDADAAVVDAHGSFWQVEHDGTELIRIGDESDLDIAPHADAINAATALAVPTRVLNYGAARTSDAWMDWVDGQF